MALVPNLIRWTIYGLFSSGENWAFDWWTQPTAGQFPTVDVFQSTVDDTATYVRSTLGAPMAAILAADSSMVGLAALYYENQQTAKFSVRRDFDPVLPGGVTGYLPLQTSLVITTLSDAPTKSTRGRMYLPANAAPMVAGHLITASTVSALVDAMALILARGNQTGQAGRPVVVSRTKTLATEIKRLRADQRADIQRRRAASQSPGAVYTKALIQS